MTNTENPSAITENRWLSEGLQRGMLRDETAQAIMHLLENLHSGKADEWNDLCVFPTEQTKLVDGAHAACDVSPDE